jgi:hypothetical protein
LHLSAVSPARDKALILTPPLTRDFDLAVRDALPDLGTYEYLIPATLQKIVYLPLIVR